ncbi:unnamed protein product [Rotaria socialis]
MNNVEVLYSLKGVNQRLNKLVQDSTFTSRLTFVKRCSDNFFDVFPCNMMLNRFCLQILPEVHDKIKWLDLESSSMRNVLCATDYPNLYGLGLYNINEESARCLFTEYFFITIDNNHDSYEEMELSATSIINYILNVFTGLIYLKLSESLYKNCARLLFDDEFLPTFRSSTLLKLNIRIQCFDDCLYLLDGRFSQLHTLCVDLVHINRPHEIKNQGDLPNLKCFSLSCNLAIIFYDELILPLLYRMSNLERLGLYIETVNTTFIDGNPLKRDVINQELTVVNYEPQNEKQSYESNNDSQNLSLVEYSCPNEIAIVRVHDHYIEQFLFNTKTYLHNNVLLHINYESLQRVTQFYKRKYAN